MRCIYQLTHSYGSMLAEVVEYIGNMVRVRVIDTGRILEVSPHALILPRMVAEQQPELSQI